mgnify:CR=1 FL=1
MKKTSFESKTLVKTRVNTLGIFMASVKYFYRKPKVAHRRDKDSFHSSG